MCFHDTQICEDYLQNLAEVRVGEFCSAESQAELNRRLGATNWFNSVVIFPDFSFGKQSKTLPLDTVVTPRSCNGIKIGVGYVTDAGPLVKTTWNKPWFNSHGHSLQTSLSLSAPEQAADVSYKIPLLKDPLEQYYLLQSGLKREDLNDTQVNVTDTTILIYSGVSINRTCQRGGLMPT